jgi:DNA-binding transcriptional LysR family regulator
LNKLIPDNIDRALLICFKTLYEERSVSRAAVKLNTSQSAISGSLARLRAVFGDPLFVRLSHGLTPTSRALELEPRVELILERLERMLRPGSNFDPVSAALTVRISASDQLQAVMLPHLLAALKTAAPRVCLKFRSPDPLRVIPWLRDGETDIGMGHLAPTQEGLRVSRLYTDRFVCIASANNEVVKKPFDIDAFCNMPQYVIRPAPSSYYVTVIEDALGRLGLRRKIALRGPSFLVAPEIVAQSDLIAVVPLRLALLHQASLRIRILEIPFELPSCDAWLYWHARTNDDPALSWFRGFVTEAAKRLS